MAQEPLATAGNYLHIYDFRVLPGREDEFIRLFEEFDYSDGNPMHKSAAQVKDGVLCRDTEDPSAFLPDRGMVGHRGARQDPQDSGERTEARVHQADRGREIRPEIRQGRVLHAAGNPVTRRELRRPLRVEAGATRKQALVRCSRPWPVSV